MTNENMYYTKIFVRAAIICFWVALFYFSLFIPGLFFGGNKERSICMYTWSDRIDEGILAEFERETGIKVRMNYYDSNEELATKLEVMPFVDCDIMMPSGYIVPALVELNLLKKIDRSKCDFFERLSPELMGKFFDPHNDYSIPLYWDVMSIGYSKKKFPNGLPSCSWEMVFEKDKVPCKKIGVVNDAREMLSIQSRYLGLEKKDINTAMIKKMRESLIKQKQWVGVYCDAQQGYFLSSEAYYMAISQREYIAREMNKVDFIGCMVPEEGSLLTIDSIAISASTKKEDLIYQFLNFLYSYKVLKQSAEQSSFLPAAQDVFDDLDQKYIGIEGLHPKMLREKNIRVFKNLLTLKQTNKFWIKVKSA